MPQDPNSPPSVRLDYTTPPMVITFDFGTLEAIEAAMGRTINEIAFNEIANLAPADETPGAQLEAMKRLSITFVRSFVCACLRCTREQLDAIVPRQRLSSAFIDLGLGFFGAVKEFNGIDSAAEQPAADPQIPSVIEEAPREPTRAASVPAVSGG